MGLSLRSLGKRLSDIGGQVVHDVAPSTLAHVASQDAGAINRAVVQPTAGFINRGVVQPVSQVAQQIAPQIGHIATIVPNEAKSIVGFATGNRQAGLNAYHAAGAGLGDAASFAQFAPRMAVTVRQTAAHLVDPHNPTTGAYTPHGGFQQAVLGKQPIQNFQDVYKQTKAQSGTQAAIGTTALNVGMGLLVAKGGIKGGAKAVDAARPVVKVAAETVPKAAVKLANSRVPLNEAGFVGGSKATGFKVAKAQDKTFAGPEGKPRFEVSDKGAKINIKGLDTEGQPVLGNKLGDVLDHPALYKQYPDLKNLKIKQTHEDGVQGSYNPVDNSIKINPRSPALEAMVAGKSNPEPFLKNTILHEVQHAIQVKEKFASGGDVSGLGTSGQALIQGLKKSGDYGPLLKSFKEAHPTVPPSYLKKSFESEIVDTHLQNQYNRLAGEAEARAVGTRMDMPQNELNKNPFYNSLDVPKDELIVNGKAAVAFKKNTGRKGPQPAVKVPALKGVNNKPSKGSIPKELEPLAQEARKYKDPNAFAKDALSGKIKLPKTQDQSRFDTLTKEKQDIIQNYLNGGMDTKSPAYKVNSDRYAQIEKEMQGLDNTPILEKAVNDPTYSVDIGRKNLADFHAKVAAQPTQVVDRFANTTPEQARADFQKSWAEAYGNRPDKVRTPTELDKTNFTKHGKLPEGISKAQMLEATKPSVLHDQAGALNPKRSPAPASKTPLTPTEPKTVETQAGKGSKVGFTDQELQMGKALGLNKKAMVKMKAQDEHALERAFPLMNKMSPEELAALPADRQMATAELRGMGPPSKEKIAASVEANPYKSNVHPIEQGNYTEARLAGGAVADPIRVVGRIADYHLGRLAKESPAAYSGFWDAVEKGKVPEGAPSSLKEAANWFREVANGVHKETNVLGTPTLYQKNWELRAATIKDVTPEQIVSGDLGGIIKHTLQRKYATHAEFVQAAERAGLVVEKNPQTALRKYVSATTATLERKAIANGLAEADAGNLAKVRTIDLGGGAVVKLSKEGLQKAKGVQLINDAGKVMSLYDAVNAMAKGSLLSLSQFHTVNISLLRAGPSLLMPKLGNLLHGDLTMGSHPIRAVRGEYGTFRALAPGGNHYVIDNLAKAYNRGDVAFASRHGVPFGKTSYGELGGKFNIGHHTVFEKQLPMMHKEIVGAMRDTIKTYGYKEGSPEAMALGKVMDATMGFINREANNIPPTAVKGIQRILLAGQFTPSKILNVYNALTKGGAAGSVARADVAANAITGGALIAGIGALLGQKSDDIRDLALRTLIDPAGPTNTKDKRGDTQEVRIPMTYTAEIAHILGLKLARQKDGHLGVDFTKVQNTLSADGPATEWLRARLSPALGTGVKVATNTSFGQKPLYDPNAPIGTKIAQAATTITQGVLPIGTQGIAYTDTVKKHLPGPVQEVLDANTPGANPIAKSALSSVGFTLRTDKTVGKGRQSTVHFGAVDWALGQAKNNSEKTALQNWFGSKKNPVTGKYNVMPNVHDTARKAKDLLDAPNTINILTEAAQKELAGGNKVDPLWLAPKDQITKTLAYQAMPPGGPDRTHWLAQNGYWYQPLSDQRTAFFNSVPKGDPNKPNAPIEYPSPTPEVAAKQKQFFSLSDSAQRSSFLRDNPEVQQQLDRQVEYNNKLREAQGYSALDTFPTAAPGVQKVIDAYNAVPKGGGKKGGNLYRAKWIESHPNEYAAMTQYFTQASLYGLEKSAGQAEYKDTGFDQKGLKDIYNLGQHDVGKYTDANGNTFYALGGNDNGGSSSSSRFASSGSRQPNPSAHPYAYAVSPSAGGKPARPKVSVRNTGTPKGRRSKVAAKPKVSLKKSLV